MKLFNHADTFQRVFPQLDHTFQWHLAITGNQAALKDIAAMDLTNNLGLAESS